MNKIAKSRRGLGPNMHGGIVCAVGIAAYAWSLFLYFQYDDLWLLVAAPLQVEDLFSFFTSPSKLIMGEERVIPMILQHLFQPVLWILNVVEEGISGTPLQAWVFHSTSVLAHGLTCMLLHRLFRQILGKNSALIAALFFAVHPAGAQAVSWTAARGDLLVVTFTVMALLSLWNATGDKLLRRSFFAGVFMFLALGCKPTAVSLCLPIVVLVFSRREQATPKLLAMCMVLVILPILVGIFIRARYLGTWSIAYINAIQVEPEQFPRMIPYLPKLLAYLLLTQNPWNDKVEFAPYLASIPRAPLFLSWITLCIPAFLVQTRKVLLRTGLALGIMGLVMFPALYHWHLYPGSPGVYLSRSLYPVAAVLAFVVGAMVSALEETRPCKRAFRWIAGLSLAVCFVTAINGLVQVARMEIHAATQTRARISSVVREAESFDAEVTHVLVDPFPAFLGVLMTFNQIESALQKPFREHGIGSVHVTGLSDVLGPDIRPRLAGKIRILSWDEESQSFVAKSGLLPAITTSLPALRKTNATGTSSSFVPESRVTPRSIHGIQILFDAPVNGSITCEVVTESTRLEKEVSILDGRGIFSTMNELEFFLSADVQQLVLGGQLLDKSGLAVKFLDQLPRIKLVSPLNGSILKLNELPILSFRDFPEGHKLQLLCHLEAFGAKLRIRYEAAYSELTRNPDASISYSPALEHYLAEAPFKVPGLEWNKAMDLIYTQFLAPYGATKVPITWEVRSIDPNGRNVTGRSVVGRFVLMK